MFFDFSLYVQVHFGSNQKSVQSSNLSTTKTWKLVDSCRKHKFVWWNCFQSTCFFSLFRLVEKRKMIAYPYPYYPHPSNWYTCRAIWSAFFPNQAEVTKEGWSFGIRCIFASCLSYNDVKFGACAAWEAQFPFLTMGYGLFWFPVLMCLSIGHLFWRCFCYRFPRQACRKCWFPNQFELRDLVFCLTQPSSMRIIIILILILLLVIVINIIMKPRGLQFRCHAFSGWFMGTGLITEATRRPTGKCFCSRQCAL